MAAFESDSGGILQKVHRNPRGFSENAISLNAEIFKEGSGGSKRTRMKVGKKLCDLLVCEAAIESWHLTPPFENDDSRRGVDGGGRGRLRWMPEYPVQIGRYLLQRQIIVFMTMRTPDFVEVLAFFLLSCQRRRGVAARRNKAGHSPCEDHRCRHPPPSVQ